MGKRLGEIGEDALVEMLVGGLACGDGVEVGAGDDCAVLASGRAGEVLLLKTDCVVEGVHYTAETPAGKVGRKVLARVLSDIAAMGGRPWAALVTVVMPAEREVSYVKRLYGGLERLARQWGVSVVGGETASGRQAMISVALLGRARAGKAVLRSGASAGDWIYVTGRLGGSLGSGRHLSFEPRIEEAAWLVERSGVTAMMDLSDGMGKDLPRLVKASGVGAEVVVAEVPRRRGVSVAAALGDGEDYELLLTTGEEISGRQMAAWRRKFARVGLTCVGRIVEGDGVRWSGEDGAVGGWEHFRGCGG